MTAPLTETTSTLSKVQASKGIKRSQEGIIAGTCGAAAITLWFWRKVGWYLFILMAIPSAILNLILGGQFLISLFPLYSLSTLWALLRPRWKYFY